MTTLHVQASVGADGRLRIDVPTDLPPGEVSVEVRVEERISPPTEKKRNLSRFIGKLSWQGDAVAEQRRQRDEWER